MNVHLTRVTGAVELAIMRLISPTMGKSSVASILSCLISDVMVRDRGPQRLAIQYTLPYMRPTLTTVKEGCY